MTCMTQDRTSPAMNVDAVLHCMSGSRGNKTDVLTRRENEPEEWASEVSVDSGSIDEVNVLGESKVLSKPMHLMS